MLHIYEFPDFATISQTLSEQWLTIVNRTPADQPCSFALAGGSTPAPIYRQFDALFAKQAQRSIQLLATDERWVADSDSQSNEGLFRHCFQHSAAHWQLLSLKNEQPDPLSAATAINARLQQYCDHTLSAVLLGMGTDGHIASLFPEAPELIVYDANTACVAALHPQTQQPRMSLSFSRLLATKRIWLVITGAEKRAVLTQAQADSPIGALLAAAQCDVEVFWCP